MPRPWRRDVSSFYPGIDPLVVRRGDKVRIRIGNLTMTNHPIHIHGHEFVVAGTDGGPTPRASRWPEVTADIAVGQMRQLEFVADEEGDWSLHCHKSHHTMNAMGHGVPTVIGVDHRGVVKKITDLVPDYNTAPMMTGDGPFGAIGIGGMFSLVKVRKDEKAGDYKDPGWFKHPAGTVAYEWNGALAAPTRAPQPATEAGVEVTVRKPTEHKH
jgi:manganese oxidase